MSEHAVMPLEDYKRACDYIRYHADTTESIKSGELVEKIDALYIKANSDGIQSGYAQGHEAGYNSGFTEGEHSGIALGKQEQRKAFWNTYTANGTRKNYMGAFCGHGWNTETLDPTLDITVGDATHIFWHCRLNDVDLVKHFENLGVNLDFSNCTNYYNAFAYAYIKRIGKIDISNITSSYNSSGIFAGANIPTIDELVVSEKTGNLNIFSNNSALKNITFTGVIAKNGLNLQWSTQLSKASHISIVNCLSAETSGLTVTLSLTAVKKAFETSDGANDGNTSEEWLNLIATKPNWTINLI